MSHRGMFELASPKKMNMASFKNIFSSASGFGYTQDLPSQSSLILGNNSASQPSAIFLRFSIPELSPNSYVKTAKVRLKATSSASSGTIDVACLEPDGIWNKDSAAHTFVPVMSVSQRTKVQGFSPVPFGFLVRGPTNNTIGINGATHTSDYDFKLSHNYTELDGTEAPNSYSLSQTIKADITETLSSVIVRMRKVGTPTGGVICRVWNMDQTNLVPTTVLTSSNILSWSSVSTAYTQVVIFFNETVSLASGQYYLFEMVAFTPSSTTNYAEVRVEYTLISGALDTNERIGVVATQAGFSQGNYPCASDLPFLYSTDGSTILTPPHNSIVQTTLPESVDGQFVEIDVTKILREWVNSFQFKHQARNQVAFVLESSTYFGSSTERTFDRTTLAGQPRLMVDFIPNRVHIS